MSHTVALGSDAINTHKDAASLKQLKGLHWRQCVVLCTRKEN